MEWHFSPFSGCHPKTTEKDFSPEGGSKVVGVNQQVLEEVLFIQPSRGKEGLEASMLALSGEGNYEMIGNQ